MCIRDRPCPSGPPSRVFLLRAGQKRGFPRPGLCIKRGRRGRAYFFPRKPLQKSAVSKLLPTGPSSAWRLNSALRASNNAARARGRVPVCRNRKQHDFFTDLRGKKYARPLRPPLMHKPGRGKPLFCPARNRNTRNGGPDGQSCVPGA